MRIIRPISIVLPFYLLVLSVPAYVSGEEQVRDPRTTWRVGVAEFTPDGLSSANRYLGASYPLLIHETLNRLKSHKYTEEEAKGYREVVMARERDRLIKLRDTALKKRDSDFVSGKLTGSSTGNSKLEELEESIVRLNSLNLNGIELATRKSVELVLGEDGPLLPVVIGSPAEIAEQYDLDLLVFGVIEEIQSYLFVDVYLYVDAFGSMPPLQTAFSRERMTESSQAIFDSIVRTVLGFEAADLSIAAGIDTAEIYIDGEFKGIGEVTLNYLEPGEYEIAITAYGYRDYKETVLLSAGDDARISPVLAAQPSESIAVSSIPADADLYAQSQWYGRTPVDVSGNLRNLQGTVRKEGFQDFLLPSIPEETTSLELKLLPEKFDRSRIIKEEREDFYKVLAAFIISLPLPVYFFDTTNTLTQSYTAEAQLSPFQRNLDEAYKLLELRQMSLSAYVATAFVSVALFVDATLQLLEYIDRVQLSTY